MTHAHGAPGAIRGLLLLLAAVAVGAVVAFVQRSPTTPQRVVTPAQPAPPAGPVQAIARVLHRPIDEMSGIARSRVWDNVWWVHNDSGDSARIFAIDGDGKVIIPPWLRGKFHGETAEPGKQEWPGIPVHVAANIDWEDICVHDGQIWVAETGNNGNGRRDLGLYVINEPNPLATDQLRPLVFYPVRYPGQTTYPAAQWHFDCESLAIDPLTGTPYLITKHRAPGKINTPEAGANLYRLDTRFTDKENVLTKVDTRADMLLATGADFSPDGRYLAVLCAMQAWIFERPAAAADGTADDRWLSHGKAWRLDLPVMMTKQAEAICFDDNDTLRIANEQRDVFRVARAAFREVRDGE
ncbi:MAG: hypothetical protein AB7K09_10685 [Planctomycetota bacterium]